jgi:hypothetical protein
MDKRHCSNSVPSRPNLRTFVFGRIFFLLVFSASLCLCGEIFYSASFGRKDLQNDRITGNIMSDFLVGWVKLTKSGYSLQIWLVYLITYVLLNPLTQLLVRHSFKLESDFLVGWVKLKKSSYSLQIWLVYLITYVLLDPLTQLLI